MIEKEDVFKIGRFAKPHGIKGELSLITNRDLEGDAEDSYLVCEMDGILVPFYIEACRYKSDSTSLVKLDGVDSEEEARAFVNKDVFYPIDAVDEDDWLGEMTWNNIVGYSVIDASNGFLGKVVDVDESTLNVLLRVDREGGELLIPAVEEFIEGMDRENSILKVSLPEGLLDL